jgi:intermediate peptidase
VRAAGTVPPPDMEYRDHPTPLARSVDGTIEKCDMLLNNLPKARTPGEKHDMLDSVSNVLCLLLDPCEMVRQIHPDPEYKAQSMEAFARANEYMCQTNARRDLYDHLADLATPESMALLGEEQRKNVIQLKRDMESNGIHLPKRRRDEITMLNMEKEELAMQFLNEAQGKNPFGVLRNLLTCRNELALKLDFESFADQQLRGTMLDSRERVWHFLCAVGNKYRPNAEKEAQRLQLQQGEVRNRHNLTDEDRAKMAVMLRREYEADGVENYFSVANTVRGIKCLCSEVFGVILEDVKFDKTEKMHADAQKFHVKDEAGAFLGVIVLDLFARPSKACQAGHITVQLGCRPHQEVLKQVGLDLPERQYPIVVLTCNAGAQVQLQRKPDGTVDGETTLMMPNEVTTCFHEFGHALHTIFGQTTVQNLAGTRGSIDYVECFSQLCEHFLTSHEFLKMWAHKVGTREPIPYDLVQRRNEVANMFRHLDTLDQVMLASIDQVLHGPQPFTVYFPQEGGHLAKRTLGTLPEYGRGVFNLAKLIIDICTPLSPCTPTERGVLRSLSFEHLSSYPAGYYGYLYSGAFARRIWIKNFEAKPLNREAGRKLVTEVMQHGAACNPREVLAKYLDEDIDDIEAWI